MDSWKGRKRPWEDDHPSDFRNTRRDSNVVVGDDPVPPLPQHAGWYARDSQGLGQRRLPPLYTPTCISSAEPLVVDTPRPSPSFFETTGHDGLRPRSHSVVDVSQSKRQRLEDFQEPSLGRFSRIDSDLSLPPLAADTQPRRFGIDPAHQGAGEVICCSSNCSGQACSNNRILMRKLASELLTLDFKVRSILHKDTRSPQELPEIENQSTEHSLQWALTLLQWNNLKLQQYADSSISHTPEQQGSLLSESTLTAKSLEAMKRGQRLLDRDEQSPPARQLPSLNSEYQRFPQPPTASEDSRRHPYSSDMTPTAHSPHRTASSSGSILMPPQSPMQISQPLRSGMLPSPSSMNFPNVPNLPPISSPSSSLQTSAQTAHLQDLQHQVSIKTLAFQTLQREYDSLLQKLERQRTKCATLEKKFEVSDVEINTLTEEKEKLQAQVISLENQVDELQQSRDEARRELVANNSQYMRIMEMASRLQAQGAEDKRRWEAEKLDLGRRIMILEEAMVTGVEKPDSETTAATAQMLPEASSSLTETPMPTLSTSSSAETISVLRAEISRLRSRTQSLETALQTMRDESLSIQAAAQKLVESGNKIEVAVSKAVEE